jgi:hypothetical protein
MDPIPLYWRQHLIRSSVKLFAAVWKKLIPPSCACLWSAGREHWILRLAIRTTKFPLLQFVSHSSEQEKSVPYIRVSKEGRNARIVPSKTWSSKSHAPDILSSVSPPSMKGALSPQQMLQSELQVPSSPADMGCPVSSTVTEIFRAPVCLRVWGNPFWIFCAPGETLSPLLLLPHSRF